MAYKNREDANAYSRKHYAENSAVYKARSTRNNRALRGRFREIINLAKSVPCSDCGIRYPAYVMHFDHLPEHEKCFTIAEAGRGGVSEERLAAEIAKCEVVCANCHAERTHRRRMGVDDNTAS